MSNNFPPKRQEIYYLLSFSVKILRIFDIFRYFLMRFSLSGVKDGLLGSGRQRTE